MDKKLLEEIKKKKAFFKNYLKHSKHFSKKIKFNKIKKLSSYDRMPFKSDSKTNSTVMDVLNNETFQLVTSISYQNLKNNYYVLLANNYHMTILMSNTCSNCPFYQNRFACQNTCKVNEKNIDGVYYDYAFNGDAVNDKLFLKDKKSNVCINDYNLFLINELEEEYDFDDLDGIFGFNPTEELNNQTFIEKLFDDKKIEYPIISLLLSKFENVYGQLVIGNLNTLALKNQKLEWKDSLYEDYWAINVDNITFKNSKISYDKNLEFIVCTASGFMILPYNIYNQILNTVSNFCDGSYGIIICYENLSQDMNKVFKSFPNLTFRLNNKDFTISPDEYLLCDSDYDMVYCIFKILPIDADIAVLGLPFMLKHYTVFDYKLKKIGFAVNYLYDNDRVLENNFPTYAFILVSFIIIVAALSYLKNIRKRKQYKELEAANLVN